MIQPKKLVIYGTILGMMMIIAAGVWGSALQNISIRTWFPTEQCGIDLLIGLVAGVIATLLVWNLANRIPALRRMEQIVASSLDMNALRMRHALMFGLIAGIPEEILFRGAIQAALGWLIAALIFGALHSITLAYGIYAALAGVLFGWLAIWRDGLWAPIAAHATIDMIMFALLIRKYRGLRHINGN